MMRTHNNRRLKDHTSSSMLSECRGQWLWTSDLKLPCIKHYIKSMKHFLLEYLCLYQSYEWIWDNDGWKVPMASWTLLMCIYSTTCEIVQFYLIETKIAEYFVTKSSLSLKLSKKKSSFVLRWDTLYLWLNKTIETMVSEVKIFLIDLTTFSL